MKKYIKNGSIIDTEHKCFVCNGIINVDRVNGLRGGDFYKNQLTEEFIFVHEGCTEKLNNSINCEFSHKFELKKNLSNTISRYTFAGDRVTVQGVHPWTGFSKNPNYFEKLSGSVHIVFANEKMANMMIKAGYKESD